ncbi:post-GPI attachment to proteins factor 6 isoform X2 [Corythoichthys intestinalis]|uniref:post-GPI attachment to proteins factor 6 isoform X2 n=1 Tax=Corythoichthys intestinalis TaxID=161448 RepID=UPI0025A51182|nr:post-GPI attachment to proteins factor 6 isoform X2 [Corythoichthys intestinalis]
MVRVVLVDILPFIFYFLFTFVRTTLGDDAEVTFVSELSSKPAQKLSKYSWYGNARLHRFHIPEETAIARWLFTVTKGHSFSCTERNVSIHMRQGAPPVINPTGTVFPNMTVWSHCHSLTVPVSALSAVTFNLSNPAPGDWFVATHLPEDDGRIEQKGFPSCYYLFQPQLSIRRAVDTPIIQPGMLLQQTAAPKNPARLKLYVPQFASSLSVSVEDCSSMEGPRRSKCSVALSLGSDSLQDRPKKVNCFGTRCSAFLSNPPWDTWLRVVVESIQDNQTVTFSIISNYTVGCKPKSVGLEVDKGSNSSNTNSPLTRNSATTIKTTAFNSDSGSPVLLSSACVWNIPVLFEETDILSLRFTPVNGPNVSVRAAHPTLLTYPLPAQVTGGTLNLQLTLNTTNITLGNSSTVVACLSPRAPVLQLNGSLPCRTGWRGWGCTDDSTAQPLTRQFAATLLLTLSNLSFLPAIVVAIKRFYITEASVYLFTMFFSTFYHACDQPGKVVLCIMSYDTLQYCDFLGSICSIWVTILCMARVSNIVKYTLFLLGTLLIAMSLQLDRRGLWNLLGPILSALLFMVAIWVCRGVQRRHCYPPSWQRWVFYLLPGTLCAFIGMCLYIFAETEDNYYYTHSIWHILVATCVVFLLPPRERSLAAVNWTMGWRKDWKWTCRWTPRICGYTLCPSSKDELNTVT